MKRIKWVFLSSEYNYGTEENPIIKQTFFPKDCPYSEEAFEAAKREAYKGEYEIYEDGQPEPVTPPTKEEELEARVAYIEMMTGLMEV